MTVYPPSSHHMVTVSAGGHGGCGQVHSRPVENGAPVKIWALDCPQCENHLRSDTSWATTLSEIPETYDEKLAREDFDKRGARDKDQVLALALAKLAGVELPESMLRPITGNLPKAIALMECPAGHPGKPGAKFCAECGQPMQQPVNALPAAPALCPEGHASAASARFCATCGTSMETAQDEDGTGDADLTRLHWKTLERLCKERGLDATGSKPELVARLQAEAVAA